LPSVTFLPYFAPAAHLSRIAKCRFFLHNTSEFPAFRVQPLFLAREKSGPIEHPPPRWKNRSPLGPSPYLEVFLCTKILRDGFPSDFFRRFLTPFFPHVLTFLSQKGALEFPPRPRPVKFQFRTRLRPNQQFLLLYSCEFGVCQEYPSAGQVFLAPLRYFVSVFK